MDISQTNPLLLANIARFLLFLLQRGAIGGKMLGLILPLAFALITGFLLFYEFSAPEAEADLLVGEVLIEETPDLVLFQGNSLAAVSNPFNDEVKQVRRVRVVVTAYSSTPWETDSNPYITASGNWVREGIVANNLLPFGTQVKIPELFGDKVFIVEDRMSWKKGNYHIDIWFPSHWEALNFGAKRTYIEVLEG